MSHEKKQQVLTLGRLGWTLRQIEEATHVRRETASGYLKAAGVPVRAPRSRRPPKPASGEGVSPDSGAEDGSKPASGEGVSPDSEPVITTAPSRAPAASACEPYRELIEAALRLGRNAKAIWQDLVSYHGFTAILMTMRYAHLAPEVARETVQLLDLEGPVVIGQSAGRAAAKTG